MDELIKALVAIAEGYSIEVKDDRYIVVENPEFKARQEWGENPCLVIDVFETERMLREISISN